MRDQNRNAAALTRTARRRGVALEQRVFRLRVQCGGRLVKHQEQRLIAHEATRQRQLLPLSKR